MINKCTFKLNVKEIFFRSSASQFVFMRKLIFATTFLILALNISAQKKDFDSLAAKLAVETVDSNKVTLMWQMSAASNIYNPDTAIYFAQQALYLAQTIKYTEGESRSLGLLAVAFRQIGNYQKSLEFFLEKLHIEENRNNPRNLASVLINIGNLYTNLEQYDQTLAYYKRADSVITLHKVKDLEYYIYNDFGDVYERLNNNDSARYYFNKSVEIATAMNDKDLIGSSIVGLGHISLRQKDYANASHYYTRAISYLQTANDDDLICEASLGMAKLYKEISRNDSAAYFASISFDLAKKDGFQSRQLDAALFLTQHFKETGNIVNAFQYLETVQALKDSIASQDKVRALQIISTNEQLRQNEIAENKRRAEEERHEQLQMLFIGIFIPLLFLLTVLLSRIKIHLRIIKFLGVISLLMLFEYLLLLLHPLVVDLANSTPVYEILMFVSIASILVPSHHRIEHWMIEKLIARKVIVADSSDTDNLNPSLADQNTNADIPDILENKSE